MSATTPSTSSPASETEWGQLVSAMKRYWWIIVLLPSVAVATAYLVQRNQDYQSNVRATVLLPGDTEQPGNSERPELMVLDDLAPFIRSRAFATDVHGVMPSTSLSIEQVQLALNGSRYSRILTVTVSGPQSDEVAQIASAVESALPAAIDGYLVPDEGPSATVRIIDPPSEPTRHRDSDLLKLLVTGAFGLLLGSLVAVTIDSARTGSFQTETESK